MMDLVLELELELYLGLGLAHLLRPACKAAIKAPAMRWAA